MAAIVSGGVAIMIERLVHDLMLNLKVRTGASGKSAAWIAVVAYAAAAAMLFLAFGAYLWLTQEYGAVIAATSVGGCFLLIALIGIVGYVATQRQTIARARAAMETANEEAEQGAAPAWLLDPRMLAVGLEVARVIGWRKIIPLALAGFVAAGFARERSRPGASRRPAPATR